MQVEAYMQTMSKLASGNPLETQYIFNSSAASMLNPTCLLDLDK